MTATIGLQLHHKRKGFSFFFFAGGCQKLLTATWSEEATKTHTRKNQLEGKAESGIGCSRTVQITWLVSENAKPNTIKIWMHSGQSRTSAQKAWWDNAAAKLRRNLMLRRRKFSAIPTCRGLKTTSLNLHLK